MRYELWVRDDWGHRWGLPLNKFATLDAAIFEAGKLSKKNSQVTYMIIEKAVPLPRIRGFACSGIWIYAADCKRCYGDPIDADECLACKGAGWKFLKN